MQRHPQAILGAAQAALRNLLARGGERAAHPCRAPSPCCRNSSDVPVRELAEQLRHALLPFGNCLLIDEKLGRGRDPAWFAEREGEMRFVLYVDEGRDESWRDLCRRQADALLLAVRSEQPPRPPGRTTRRSTEHADLDAPAAPAAGAPRASASSTARPGAGARRSTASTSTTTCAAPTTSSRIARLLARRSLGLVLSGGGARGFAAIGMVRALREQRLRRRPRRRHQHRRHHRRRRGRRVGQPRADATTTAAPSSRAARWRDWTLPMVALSRGERTSRLLQRFFGAVDIEDLPVPVLLRVLRPHPRPPRGASPRPAVAVAARLQRGARRAAAGAAPRHACTWTAQS